MTSDPPNQKLLDGALSSLWVDSCTLFDRTPGFCCLNPHSNSFVQEKERRSGKRGCHASRNFLCSPDFDPRQGLPQTTPPYGQNFHVSLTPTCCRSLPGPSVKPTTVSSQLLPFSCCLSGGPFSFFNLTTRDSKMRTMGQLGKTFCGVGGIEEQIAREWKPSSW